MSEAESTMLAVREVYGAYYTEMGGLGTAPKPQARKPMTEGKVARSQRPLKLAPTEPRSSSSVAIRKTLPVLLIFASMVALLVAYRLLAQ